MSYARPVAAAALSLVLLGATAPPAPSPAPRCDAPENRQFDFWAGDWDVTDAARGKPAGTNAVTLILGGCVLQEKWRGVEGMEGTSFNIYDRADGRWHQAWVDSRGVRLDLAGGLRDGKMILDGPERKTPRGPVVRDRITWTPLPDGRVRQHWEVSPDAGATWTDAFDGIYARR
jgi:hypothetical protein